MSDILGDGGGDFNITQVPDVNIIAIPIDLLGSASVGDPVTQEMKDAADRAQETLAPLRNDA
ncbi:hypothetical protein ACQUSR_28020 [Streptomyces sp. P1-3]|uniref:hypothetical protein n=1 Tax=Streptomyces sp. P1-3 TaxID=3421658 RepID=UPI003D36E00D